MNSIIKDAPNELALPLFGSTAACGFPSPADDHLDLSLDLNQHIIKHPAATFFVRAAGESMHAAGILNGDLLIVDRSLEAKDNSIVIAAINGELTVKRFKIIDNKGFLYPANNKFKPIPLADVDSMQIWGVVTYAIHDVRIS